MFPPCSLGRLALRGRVSARSQWARNIQIAKNSSSTDSDSSNLYIDRSSSSNSTSPRASTSHGVGHSPTNSEYINILQSCSKIYGDETPLRSKVWRNRLQGAAETLKRASSRPTRIAVVGSSVSGAQNLVTTLLDEPLSDASVGASDIIGDANSNHEKLQALQSRFEKGKGHHQGPLAIRHGQRIGSLDSTDTFTLPHSWLRDTNIEIVEIVDPSTDSTTLDELYACDMIIFVTDDLTLTTHHRHPHALQLDSTLRLLRYFAHKPATRLLVNHTTSHVFETTDYTSGLKAAIGTEAFTTLEQQTSRSSTPADQSNGNVLMHTSFDLASRANDALRVALKGGEPDSEGERTTAWASFTSLYTASGLSLIKSSMEQTPVSAAYTGIEGGKSSKGAVLLQTISYLVRQSLEQALYGVSAEIDEVRQAQGAARVLKEEVEAYKIKTKYEVFSLKRHDEHSKVHERAGDRSKRVEGSKRDSEGFVEKAFAKRLPWWRIVWKVDDVRAETEAAVDRSFAKDTERQLIFETGKLLNVAEKLQKRTESIFKILNPSSPISYRPLDSLERDHGTFLSAFHSPILLNELRQHSVDKVESSLCADLLTQPIEKRRLQLLSPGGPIDVLCLRAQRSVLATITLVGSTGLLTLVGALAGGPLGASLPSFCGPLAMQASTAAGTFAFVGLFSIWMLQSRWTRAKKRFWRDWERIASGLDSDLRSNLDNVFENVIGAQSIKAASGLEGLAMKRLSSLESLHDSIEAVTLDIKRIILKSSP